MTDKVKRDPGTLCGLLVGDDGKCHCYTCERAAEMWRSEMATKTLYRIALKDRECTTCGHAISIGERYELTVFSDSPHCLRACRKCEWDAKGLCEMTKSYRSLWDTGQDMRCSNRATGAWVATRKRCCGHHNHGAEQRGKKLGSR